VQARESSCSFSTSDAITLGETENKKVLPADPLLHNREREKEEELHTPIAGILRFFVLLAVAVGFAGDVFARFFLTTVTKSPSVEFSSVTIDDSGHAVA
jgi:hypothetical protein